MISDIFSVFQNTFASYNSLILNLSVNIDSAINGLLTICTILFFINFLCSDTSAVKFSVHTMILCNVIHS